jgi:hypothetical protein
MTQAQKIAKDKFKKAIEYRSKTGVSLKEAFAHIYGKKKTAPKKKSAPKKKIASKKVAAIKIIEKGESKSAKSKATYQQVRTKKGTFKGLKKIAGMNRTIKLDKAKRIASDWHDGQWSALYQFASSGIIVPQNYNDYQDEIQKNINIAKTNKDINELHQLSQYLYYTNLKMNKNVGVIKKKSAPKKSASKRITDIHKDSKSHNVNIRVVSGLPSYKDPDMARELELYADNDSLLYFQRRKPILINLSKKYKKGTYDIQKAAKLWRYYIDAALEKYNKEFGSRGDKWYDLMSVPDRNLLALEYAENTKSEFDLGNFTEK